MYLKTLMTTLAGLLLLALLPASSPAQTQTPLPAGTCARVKVQLSQDVAITRTAFRATLTIGNSPSNVPLQKVKVTLDIRDSANNPANAKFGISNPVLTSISDVAGTGTIAAGTQATAVWTILPTRDAAPTADTTYTVGGTIDYTQSGVSVSLPLFPAPIKVKPDPLLEFHYFLEKNVYGDDPFTPEVEPSLPFSLGLLVVNKGAGTARNLTITSSQPNIVDNVKGLQIATQVIGASVNNLPVSPSLTANLGDIGPGGTSVADFLQTASLQGTFLSFSATFAHKDDLNNPRTSIIDSVDTHFLEHVVRIVNPIDDGKPDFLYFSVDPAPTDLDPAPDSVWSSDGATAPVTTLMPTHVVADGPVTNANLTVHLVVPNVPTGFVYIRTDDPGQGVYQLTSVVRSDGKVIVPGDNAWTTHHILRLKNQPPTPQNRVHLFDDDSTGAYTLSYAPITPIKPTVTLTGPADGATFSPNTTLTLTASAASVQTTVTEVDFYADNTRIASSTATPFSAPYKPSVGTHTLKVIAIDANGTPSDPAQITITVNPDANKPPTITLTGPQDGSDVNAPATVTLSAQASDSDGSVAKVDFYNGSAFLGTAVTAPYVLTLPSLAPGAYDFTAVATDNQGATTTSNRLSLQVLPALTNNQMSLLRVVSAVRQTTAGQMLVTVQNNGSMNAVNVSLIAARTKWGGKAATSILPLSVPMLAPNSTTTFMLQFPAGAAGAYVGIAGTNSGLGFSGLTLVTP